MQNGADAYKAYGTEKSPGTHLFGISGHVAKPGLYELASRPAVDGCDQTRLPEVSGAAEN